MKRVASTRTETTVLAALACFYEQRDRAPRTVSELISRACADFAASLQLPTLTDEEAEAYYLQFGYTGTSEKAAKLTAELAATPALTKPGKDQDRDKLAEARKKLEGMRR